MKEGFEKAFSDIQTDMVSICHEYVEGEADKIYIYASYEAKTITCNYFYLLDGVLCKKNKLPAGYDVSIDRQKACMNILMEDMEKLISTCDQYEANMPTEIKIIYDIKNNKLQANYEYEDKYSFTDDKSAIDMVDEWFRQCQNEETM